MPNHYETLGISRLATSTAILRAYRRLAKSYHPDLNRHDPGASRKMAQLNEAYDVLSNPSRRAAYDQTLTSEAPRTEQRWRASRVPRTCYYPRCTSPADQFCVLELQMMCSTHTCSHGPKHRVPLVCPTCGGRGNRHYGPCTYCQGSGIHPRVIQAHQRARQSAPPPPPPGPTPSRSTVPPVGGNTRGSSGWGCLVCIIVKVIIIALVAGVSQGNCDNPTDIREANRALDRSTATASPADNQPAQTSRVDVVDIETGDCITTAIREGEEVERVTITVCSSEWEYKVLNQFRVSAGGTYPGIPYFERQVGSRCDRDSTSFLYPTQSSWLQGDRLVSCLIDREYWSQP